MTTLHQLYKRGKRLGKNLGARMKSLAKKAKNASRGEAELDEERLDEQLAEFRDKMNEVLTVNTTRLVREGEQGADLNVDGRVLVEDATIPVLLALKEEVNYQQKLYRRLVDATDDESVETVHTRLQALRDGIEAALGEANNQPVDEVREISEAVDDYLFEGTSIGEAETSEDETSLGSL